ncbi:hypothetical protein J1614_006500, partial [Plenodomus biglobosus]
SKNNHHVKTPPSDSACASKPQYIPGEPGARPITIANAFMQLTFHRDFNWDRDYVYTPAGIDDIGPVARRNLFLFLDVDVHANATYNTLLCYQIVPGNSIKFNETKFNGVLTYSDMFPWGGRHAKNR